MNNNSSPFSSINDTRDFRLGITDFTYADLYQPERLRDLAEAFYQTIEKTDAELSAQFTQYRIAKGEGFTQKDESNLLVKVAPYLSNFVARLFDVEAAREIHLSIAANEAVLSDFKKLFIQRRAKKLKAELLETAVTEFAALDIKVHQAIKDAATNDEELAVAKFWQAHKDDHETLHWLEQWAAALPQVEPARMANWLSYRSPHALDYSHLVKIERRNPAIPEMIVGPDATLRRRDGFKLTDERMKNRQILDEAHYCLYCHERDKDSCSSGFIEKDGSYRQNPLHISLAGCPLDEKISEMNLLRGKGDVLGALALAIIDNPMCAGTGHRICNDCMKACVFQKQEPVNIPEIETGTLTDVLKMPYGVEIYALLTRWNPLNIKRPFAAPYNGKNVLVVGLGPAGYTLAHYLLNEGFGVIGIDGLKIEPLPKELTGEGGNLPRPIRDWAEIYKQLDERVLEGFGGVSEYGITVRWDKNFLTLLHLILARRDHLRIYGGVRFGGTMTIEDAWELGFHHIAIATGAGKPTIIGMKNNLIRGIRKASDLLMALQLTGAFKEETIANLQVQLPAIVIGGGLTGVDTTTEIAAYYPVQVEKMLHRYESLAAAIGEEKFWQAYPTADDKALLQKFIEHGRAIRAERERASLASEEPNFVPLVRSWGGATLVYRKSLQDSPAYRLNHEEVAKALEEGISIVENMNPVEAIPDESGVVSALKFERQAMDENGKWHSTGEFITLPARTVCVAAGTSPNVIYEKEYPGTFAMDERQQYFKGFKLNNNGQPALEPVNKGEVGFFTSYQSNGHYITYYGDNHPKYAGNVVKAMASAKHGYLEVARIFATENSQLDPAQQAQREASFTKFAAHLDDQLIARVVRVERLTPTIIDVIVHAPMAARKFEPGQFYRLQNFEVNAPEVKGTRLMMEGLALTGAWNDPEKGLLSMIVLEMGGSSNLCAALKPGEEVIVMGPTGTPTEIPENENVLLAGGGLGNAVLFSIAKALKAKNNHVIYFAGYKNASDVFKREEIEAGTDQIIWSSDVGTIQPHRPQDSSFNGNIVQAMQAYNEGKLGERMLRLSTIDRLIVIGSDKMMGAVKVARKGVLAEHLNPDHVAIGSINSPMQCMMKEVCAQCLQKHIDPVTGKESFVFSCFNQDQLLDAVDFGHLDDRLKANSVQEKLTRQWLGYLLEGGEVQAI